MSKKKNKKKYNTARSLRLVCVDCRCLWKECPCKASKNSDVWILVNDVELEHYYETGLVPDHKSELLWFEGAPEKPNPIPVEHPPVWRFKID